MTASAPLISAFSAQINAASRSPSANALCARSTLVRAATDRFLATAAFGLRRSATFCQRSSHRSVAFELISISDQPNHRVKQDVVEKSALSLGGFREVVQRPHHGPKLPAHLLARAADDATQSIPIGGADNEEVDVARAVVAAADEGPKEEGVRDPSVAAKEWAEADGKTAGAHHEVTHGRVERVSAIHTPQAKVSDAPTDDDPAAFKTREGTLHGVGVGVGAPDQLVRVELFIRNGGQ